MSGIPWRFDGRFPLDGTRFLAWVTNEDYDGAYVLRKWRTSEYVETGESLLFRPACIKAWCPIDKPEVTPDETV